MRDHGLIWLLMIMSCLSLVGLGISGMLVSKAQKLKAQRAARISAVSSPHVKTQPVLDLRLHARRTQTQLFGFGDGHLGIRLRPQQAGAPSDEVVDRPDGHLRRGEDCPVVGRRAGRRDLLALRLPVVWIMACR